MRLATILTSVCLLAATTADAAKWETPGSGMWGACARALRPPDTPQVGYNAGLCDGTISAVATRVVVRYFEAHPELLQLDGVALVETALREAWPCKR
jgi:hypothetical protein